MTIPTADRILSIGETLMDCVQPYGETAPTNEYPGGSPANVAMTLGRLGRDVHLATWIGKDSRGDAIVDHFSASKVTVTPESLLAPYTSTALAKLDERGAAQYVFDFDWSPVAPLPLSGEETVVHAGSISATQKPGAETVLDALIRARTHAVVTFDPNARPSLMGEPHDALAQLSRFICVADVVKVSDEDIEWLTDSSDIESVAKEWLAWGPQLVIVTRGKDGALALSASGHRVESTPEPVKVADTVGAGDSFMGAIIDSLCTLGLTGTAGRLGLRGITADQIESILHRAESVANVTVSRSGANPPWSHELCSSL